MSLVQQTRAGLDLGSSVSGDAGGAQPCNPSSAMPCSKLGYRTDGSVKSLFRGLVAADGQHGAPSEGEKPKLSRWELGTQGLLAARPEALPVVGTLSNGVMVKVTQPEEFCGVLGQGHLSGTYLAPGGVRRRQSLPDAPDALHNSPHDVQHSRFLLA